MTIPLDDLYHYINGLFPEPVCMYLFLPHGSRNISDVVGVSDKTVNFFTPKTLPMVLCHDQEPLNYQLYQNHSDEVVSQFSVETARPRIDQTLLKHSNIKLPLRPWFNIYDQAILLHSEKNSLDLEWYEQNGFVGVHYWCHGIVAKDWYRFAQYDYRLNHPSIDCKNFLIYCRDWSGSREYRAKFQELLIKNNLLDSSITKMSKINSDGSRLKDHVFVNNELSVSDIDLLDCLDDNCCDSSESAAYQPNDFNQSNISVVLETVFDSSKIHLTEKVLRPIAVGHPFILAAGPNSLEYLRSYGFKTFSPWIDEGYDQEPNSLRRLEKIIAAMQEFNHRSDRDQVLTKLKEIAEFNRQWFFSDKFDQAVLDELSNNIRQALSVVNTTRGKNYLSTPPRKFKSNPELRRMILLKLRQLRSTTGRAR